MVTFGTHRKREMQSYATFFVAFNLELNFFKVL